MQKQRSGFTLIELIICIAILAIVVMMVIGLFGSSLVTHSDFVAKVVRKYEVAKGNATQRLIDIQRPSSTVLEVISNDDNFMSGKYNSASVHANLIEGRTYHFWTRGDRNEYMSLFPNIERIEEVHTQ